MANSYRLHTGNGSTTTFNIDQIDGWINSGFLKVYINDVIQNTGYTFLNINGVSPQVQFTSAPANGAIIRIQRETPATVSGFQGNVVNFNDGSVLTATDLDNMAKGLLHRVQEGEDTGSGALGKTLDGTAWDAKNYKITNLAPGTNNLDAVNMQQFSAAVLFGGAVAYPQTWSIVGTGDTTYDLSPDPANLMEEMFIVEVGGIIQAPNTYTITSTGITFTTALGSGVPAHIRNFGVSRVIPESVTTSMIVDGAVTANKIQNLAVTTGKLADGAVTTAKIADDAVTYAKMQNVSATDRILGRSSTGSGNVEEIVCTAVGRALLDDSTVAAQRTTLGLGGLALKDTISNDEVSASAAIAYSKLATVAGDKILGRNSSTSGTPQEVPCTSFGRSVLASTSANNFITTVLGTPVPIGYVLGGTGSTATFQDVQPLMNAGNWLYFVGLYGGAGNQNGDAIAGIAAYNEVINTLAVAQTGSGVGSGNRLCGFAIRVS